MHPPPLLKASSNYFFFEASRVKNKAFKLLEENFWVFSCLVSSQLKALLLNQVLLWLGFCSDVD